MLHPESYVAQLPHLTKRDGRGSDDAEGEAPAVWELPDTAILFRGYLEAGRVINVFDWYQSFAGVLETQRDRGLEIEDQQAGGSSSDVAVDGHRESNDGENRDGPEVEDERWGMEVQARFIRGVHELDFMGFLKHTGRKPDHVARTVFDVSE